MPLARSEPYSTGSHYFILVEFNLDAVRNDRMSMILTSDQINVVVLMFHVNVTSSSRNYNVVQAYSMMNLCNEQEARQEKGLARLVPTNKQGKAGGCA